MLSCRPSHRDAKSLGLDAHEARVTDQIDGVCLQGSFDVTVESIPLGKACGR